VTPVSGTIDAREPHEPGVVLPRQGIGSANEPVHLTLNAVGADASCFTLCETVIDPLLGPNGIAGVTDLGGGNYEIVLDHPITAGGVTTIRYVHDAQPVVYVSHPGNVNGDGVAAVSDILSVFDILTGTVAAPHGAYSTDIDHSGAFGAPDVIRLIDLLNGAATFDPWLNTGKPTNDSCP
jgi:hypothetical protein